VLSAKWNISEKISKEASEYKRIYNKILEERNTAVHDKQINLIDVNIAVSHALERVHEKHKIEIDDMIKEFKQCGEEMKNNSMGNEINYQIRIHLNMYIKSYYDSN